MNTELKHLLKSKKIIVTCGSGGVGKTTTSAALGIMAAQLGKKCVVVTIDPAKRLATSLGLKTLHHQPTPLQTQVEKALGKKITGEFFAVMPDTQKTFEHFVESMAAGNKGLIQRILKTTIYKIFTQDFSGTNEYMAAEKLYQLYHSQEDFDLIILDTPPSINTKTFLEAPQLLAHFFDNQLLKWLTQPKPFLLSGGVQKILDVLQKITGQSFIAELIEFTKALFELRTQFLKNFNEVQLLLKQEDVAFVMVSSPARFSHEDTEEFLKILEIKGYPFWGFLINRVLLKKLGFDYTMDFKEQLPVYSGAFENQSSDLLEVLQENAATLKYQLEQDIRVLRQIQRLSKHSRLSYVAIPEQDRDVHSIEALVELFQSL